MHAYTRTQYTHMTHTCIHNTHTDTHIYMCTHAHVHIHVHTHTFNTYTHMYTYTCMHTHMHTHAHTERAKYIPGYLVWITEATTCFSPSWGKEKRKGGKERPTITKGLIDISIRP